MSKRKYIRAPFRSVCLYVDGDIVLKARTNNISERGILLSEVPRIPILNPFPLMLILTEYPRFQSLQFEDLKKMTIDDFPQQVVKVRAQLTRSFEGESGIDKIFNKFIGCELVNLDEKFDKLIKNYVETYTKNIVYLLSLFESLGNKTEQLEALRNIAHFLGHDRRMKIPLLRAKVLHDYQSLESL